MLYFLSWVVEDAINAYKEYLKAFQELYARNLFNPEIIKDDLNGIGLNAKILVTLGIKSDSAKVQAK